VHCGNSLAAVAEAGRNFEHGDYNLKAETSAVFDRSKQRLDHATSVFQKIWAKLLLPEKLITIGSLIGFVSVFFWGKNYLFYSLVYLASMVLAIVLVYLSQEQQIIKKIEHVRWQILIGAFWLGVGVFAWFFADEIAGLGLLGRKYMGSLSNGIMLSVLSSILIVSGALMLHSLLLRKITSHKNN
jgi:hypothetical protein